MQKKALIVGVSGQDGSYLSKFLLTKGYEVWGTTRSLDDNNLFRLRLLGINRELRTLEMNPYVFEEVLIEIKKITPDEIYFLAGQSSVSYSFKNPLETIQSNVLALANILEACRLANPGSKIYAAGSSECFGETGELGANETSRLNPVSPYGVSKASILLLTKSYRNAYNLFVCTGILFNHESELRPEHFVTKKIISTVRRIANGSNEKLILGNTSVIRDWGWAPEYIEAMWLMLQQKSASDYVIGTGKKYSLEQFVKKSFDVARLNWKDFVETDHTLLRPKEIKLSVADPEKAFRDLGWSAETTMPELVEKLIENQI